MVPPFKVHQQLHQLGNQSVLSIVRAALPGLFSALLHICHTQFTTNCCFSNVVEQISSCAVCEPPAMWPLWHLSTLVACQHHHRYHHLHPYPAIIINIIMIIFIDMIIIIKIIIAQLSQTPQTKWWWPTAKGKEWPSCCCDSFEPPSSPCQRPCCCPSRAQWRPGGSLTMLILSLTMSKAGLHKLWTVLLSWADRGSCAPKCVS